VAAVLVGLAAWLTVGAVIPQPADPGVPTVVAARDLALGSTVSADDLRVERRPEAQRPAGSLADPGAAVGQVVSGPVLAGEIVTPARFRGASQLVGLAPGLVAVSLPVTDPILLTTLRPADTVSVLATGSGQPLATVARVFRRIFLTLASSRPGDAGPGHLIVAVTADEARNLAVALGPQGATAGFSSRFVAEPACAVGPLQPQAFTSPKRGFARVDGAQTRPRVTLCAAAEGKVRS
jgi:hypothetical protein